MWSAASAPTSDSQNKTWQFSNSVHCDLNSLRLNAAKTSATKSVWFTITARAYDTIVSPVQLYLKYCTQRNHRRSCCSIEIIILCYDARLLYETTPIDRSRASSRKDYLLLLHSTHRTANSPPNDHCFCCYCYCFVRWSNGAEVTTNEKSLNIRACLDRYFSNQTLTPLIVE